MGGGRGRVGKAQGRSSLVCGLGWRRVTRSEGTRRSCWLCGNVSISHETGPARLFQTRTALLLLLLLPLLPLLLLLLGGSWRRAGARASARR